MAVDSAVRGGEACALLRPALHALHTRLGFVCEEGARSRAALAAQAGEVRRLGALIDALTLQAQRMQHKQRDAVAHLLHAQAGAAAQREAAGAAAAEATAARGDAQSSRAACEGAKEELERRRQAVGAVCVQLGRRRPPDRQPPRPRQRCLPACVCVCVCVCVCPFEGLTC